MTDPIDVARFEEISDGTAAGVRELVELWIEDSRETLAAMTAAAARWDRASLVQLAHRLAGTCNVTGAPALAARLYDLEQQASTMSAAEVASAMAHLEAEIGSTMRFLTTYLEGRQMA
jgi:HPt (histidine-containing phosphotransfer) domain-containing protein